MLARQNTTAGAETFSAEEETWIQGGALPPAHTRLVRTREAAVKALPDIHIHLAKIDAITKSLFPQHMRVVEEQQAKLTLEIDAAVALLTALKAAVDGQ